MASKEMESIFLNITEGSMTKEAIRCISILCDEFEKAIQQRDEALVKLEASRKQNEMGCENPAGNCTCPGCFLCYCESYEVDPDADSSFREFEQYAEEQSF